MKSYIAYLRVSTQKQQNSNLGLEAQQNTIEKYVNASNGKIMQFVTEIETAGSKDKISIGQQISIHTLLRKRPLLLAAIKVAEITGSIIVVKESSRLTRFSLLMEFLLKSNVKFEFADAPNDSPFLIKLKTSLAEEELLRISDRTRSALKALKNRGFVKAKFKHGLTLENIKKGSLKKSELAKSNENNIKATGYIVILKTAHYTYQKIADKLNTEGFQSSQGKKFYASTVMMLYKRTIIR